MLRLVALFALLLAACGTADRETAPDAGNPVDAAEALPDGGDDPAPIDGGQADGGESDGGASDAPYSCEPATGDDACDTCQKSSCCDESKACFDDPRCLAYFRCANPCPTTSCVVACEQQHPEGFLLFASWFGCLDRKCPGPCNL
jgi:hypothetical protein